MNWAVGDDTVQLPQRVGGPASATERSPTSGFDFSWTAISRRVRRLATCPGRSPKLGPDVVTSPLSVTPNTQGADYLG